MSYFNTILLPAAMKNPDAIQAFPPGLKMVAGNPASKSAQDPMVVTWSCGIGQADATTGKVGVDVVALAPDGSPLHAHLEMEVVP